MATVQLDYKITNKLNTYIHTFKLSRKSKGIILQRAISHIPWVAMSPLHQAEVMPVPAPTARVSYGTMGWLMRMNLASTLFMNLRNGEENTNNRISQRGKVQPDLLNRYISFKQPKWISLPMSAEISSSIRVKSPDFTELWIWCL